jgi:hypothetical protein
MSRAELLVPQGWAPRRGSIVEILPHRDEPVPPSGVWRIIERAPDEPGPHWWAQPHDEAARSWAARHPRRIVQGCLVVKGLRLVPPGHAPRPPERKSRGGRR